MGNRIVFVTRLIFIICIIILTGCQNSKITDNEMRELFKNNRELFDKIKDDIIKQIGVRKTYIYLEYPNDKDSKYEEIITKICLKKITVSGYAQKPRIYFVLQNEGIVGSGFNRGIIYTFEKVNKVYANTLDLNIPYEEDIRYSILEDNWYIMHVY